MKREMKSGVTVNAIVDYAADSLTRPRCISSKGICTPLVERSTTPTSIRPSMSACTALKSRLTRRATSRMVISPAPAIASMICMRFGDSFFQSNSALGNVMDSPRYSVAEKPASNVFSKALNGSLRFMAMVNVRIMLPPAVFSDISLKVLPQLVDAGECGVCFGIADMLVITFTGFVVIANDTNAIFYISQAILVVVPASSNRRGNEPDNDFHKASIGEVSFIFYDDSSAHDGEYYITHMLMSKNPSLDILKDERKRLVTQILPYVHRFLENSGEML